jgi:hypothetical protein
MGCLYTIFIQPFVIIGRILWNILLLVPYLLALLLLWFAFTYFSWGNLDFLDTSALTGWFSNLPTWSSNSTNTNTPSGTNTTPGTSTPFSPQVAQANYRIIFRFIWQGEQIYYLGKEIDEDYFYQLAREAKGLNGKVEVQQAPDVPPDVVSRRETILEEIDVANEIKVVG